MAKLKTFEDYIASLDSAEEIEKEVMDQGEPEELGTGEEVITKDQPEAEAPEEVTESEDSEDEDETETQIADLEDDEEETEESDDEETEESDDEETEESDDEEESEEAEAQKTVEEMIKEVYERVKSEAKVWEDDMHDTHTIESYLKENAALVAMMGAKTLKESRKDITQEQYEAACSGLKESYCKKIDEMMEAWNSEGEEA